MDDILCPGQTASEQRPANKVIWNMLSKCLACLVGSQNKHSNGLAYSVHLPCRLGGGQSLKAGLWWCSACCWCRWRWCCPAACSDDELVTIEWIWWVSPVQSYAQHPVLPQCPQEQIYVSAPRLPVLHQGAILQRYLAHPVNIFVHLYIYMEESPKSRTHLHLFLFSRVSLVLYPPLSPAPSARMSSSSGVAPPVIRDRIRVRAFWLK